MVAPDGTRSRDTTLTIGVGAAVDQVLDHPVDGRIVRPAPDHVAIIALGGQVQPMLDEPEQGLPDTAEFGDPHHLSPAKANNPAGQDPEARSAPQQCSDQRGKPVNSEQDCVPNSRRPDLLFRPLSCCLTWILDRMSEQSLQTIPFPDQNCSRSSRTDL